mgnify:FL=1
MGLCVSAEVDFVGDVTFVCAPLEKLVEDGDAVLFLHYPKSLELVVLCHLPSVFLHELVNVLA